MSYLALGPVGEALFAVLQDATLLALLGDTGPVGDIPEDPTYPFLWYEVQETQQHGGFGTKPGVGQLPELDVRLHAFSDYGGGLKLQGILQRAIQLLADAPAVAGYSSWAIFYDRTVPAQDAELNGVKVKEAVAFFRLFVEEP